MSVIEATGRILHLQRLSTEDGPGIRTTVFFKGCPLRCTWCHNPESFLPQPQTQWFAVRCLGCQTCIEICPNQCLTMTDSGLIIDRERCQGCGACAEACPTGALEILGRIVSVDELLYELLKDRTYYEKSGGGVTLSGGEPTLQAEFAEALLRALKNEEIHTALDTCGLTSQLTLERFIALHRSGFIRRKDF
jgi:pyruvate formate lyase activating enzyme